MNWLAHVYLAEADVESRLGSILADLVKGKDRKQLSPGIRRFPPWRHDVPQVPQQRRHHDGRLCDLLELRVQQVRLIPREND